MINNFLIDNFKNLTTTPENVEQLKKLVLQMAVQGKLTAMWREENPDVEPASVLLEKIKVAKEELIRNKIVKKGKKQPPAHNELISIPDEWCYTDLDEITQFITDGTHQTPRYANQGRIFLSAQNVKPFRFMPENHKYVSEEDYQSYIQNRKTEKGDLLLGRVGAGIGETAVVDVDLDFAIYVSLGLVKTFKNYSNPNYLAIVFNSPYGYSYSKGNISSKGGSAGNFNLGRIRAFPVPFPPLAEQQAIVSQVEKLFTQIDQLHALAQKRLNYREKSAKALFSKINHAENDTELQETWQTLTAHFHTLTQSKESIKQLRQSILQMAVQGKLTAKWREENPDVEPASVLLEKIKAEKEQLIKEGKIKRQKTLPSLTMDEIPFKLPESWEWIRLSNTGEIYNGNSISKSEKETLYCKVKNGMPYLSTKDIGYGTIIENYNTGVYIPQNEPKFKIAKSNSVLICSEGGSAGKKISFITRDICFGNKLLTNSNFTSISSLYTFYLYQSSYFANAFNSSMTGLIGGISISNFKLLPFALPPHEEQKAIVSKVKQLMAWCDELEKKIEKRDAYQEKMMQAVVKQAFKTEN